jgi:hypothetical protein
MPAIIQPVDGLAPDLGRRLRLLISEIFEPHAKEWTARGSLAQSGAFVMLDLKCSGFARTLWIYYEDLAFQPEQVRSFLKQVLQEYCEAASESK